VKASRSPITSRHYRSASAYEELVGFSRAVRRGSRIAVSGTAPLDEIILEAVEGLGGSIVDIVRTRIFVIDAGDWEAVGRAHGEFFRETYPAATMVVVKGLLDPRWRVEIEAEAEVDSSDR
jgi:enamine deaminase RidA (YjgF/YER057c/UK114 family)